ncbi:MAG: glycoside hydrolase family 3 C-terminal domain-containing protein [Clostridia bacterium]|nr:glycoside hydrolase family 3 C-terminal domain-containing protein [Clostridia bacterium]
MINPEFVKRAISMTDSMNVYEQISQIRLNARAIQRLGIPQYNFWNECLHGVARAGVATVFPQAIAMASSWNDKLMLKVADVISTEARAKYNEYKKAGLTKQYQGLNMLSPNINIFRDPRWGRGHETYGEDPYLTSRMAISFVKGLQGDKKYRKCGATLKHYAVHSGPERGRREFDAITDSDTLYDTYLRAFANTIKEANPASVMTAYNAVNGVPCTCSKRLVDDILRKEFGFDGYVISDYGSTTSIYEGHEYTANYEEACKVALEAGLDLDLGHCFDYLESAYEKGYISSDCIRTACIRVLTSRIALGEFDQTEYDSIPYDVIDCKEHRQLNLEMARESVVLLKNNGILPLSPDAKVAVIGPNADDISTLYANYNGNMSRYTTILRGMQDENENTLYAMGCPHYLDRDEDWDEQMEDEAECVARHSDIIVMVMGLNPSMEGEETGDEGAMADGSTWGDKGDRVMIDLPPRQVALYHRLRAIGKPIVFVNVSGSAVNLTDMKDSADAILQCFYPGALGGQAVSEIIYGKVNPSAKLPVTFYKSIDDLPAFSDYGMKGRTYRYFEGEVVYPFGYGISYTTYNYSDLRYDDSTLTVKISNVGDMDGMEVVQVYSIEKDKKTLIDFQKVLVKSGQSIEVTLNYDKNATLTSVGGGIGGEMNTEYLYINK